jgi:hypothetical protein
MKTTYTGTCFTPAVRFSITDGTTDSLNDGNGVDLTLPTQGTWTPVTVFFNQMMTTGASVSQTHVFDATTATSMKWQFQQEGAGYNISIDDIYFVTTTPPTAAVPPTWPVALIDDMEGGTNQILLNGQGGVTRGGYWYSVVDPFGSTICPPAASPSAPFIMNSPGYPSSPYGGNYCARISGVLAAPCGPPWSTCPYVEMGFNFLNPQGPYNISTYGYTGIEFYAKAATAGTSVAIGISDATTIPSSDVNSFTNSYTTSWALYKVTFASMVTGGWGVPTTHALDTTTITAVTFKDTTGSTTYDFSVDDISFY